MMSAKRNRMLRFEVSQVLRDPIGAKNGERERERERERENEREVGLRRSAMWV